MDTFKNNLKLVTNINYIAFIVYIFHSLFLYDYGKNTFFVIISIAYLIVIISAKYLLHHCEKRSAIYIYLLLFYFYIFLGLFVNNMLAMPFIFLLIMSFFALSFLLEPGKIYLISVSTVIVIVYIHFFIMKFENFPTVLVIFASSIYISAYFKSIVTLFYKKMEELSTTDDFTGLLNQKGFFKKLEEEYYRSVRYNKNFTLIMLDSDDLKCINDNYGHKYGSMVIKMIGDIISNNIRRTDFACRYGGDEFMLCLVETAGNIGVEIADRLRSTIELNSLFTDKGKDFKITVSVGVAIYPDSGERLFDVIDKADRALYLAKASGKNKVKLLLKN
jgi:diguanylate cyclase (GGDEF)-like protein